jgi:hypothetical protein
MPSDANAPLGIATATTAVSVTATVTNGVGGTGTYADFETTPGSGRWGYVLRMRYPYMSVGVAGVTFQTQVQQSTATSSSWTNLFQGQVWTPTTATSGSAIWGEEELPFIMTQRYAQVVITFSGTTGTPTLTYAGELVPEFPA